jgi:geranylgeranyl reductase family protein
MSHRQFDIAIIGAGPAGARAACHLAQAGRKVVVLEAQTLPRNKPCGGGLVGRASQFLPAGFTPVVEQPCHQALVGLDSGRLQFTARRETPIVNMIMRAAFDQALVEYACCHGAELVEGCRVEQVEEQGEKVLLRAGNATFTADWLIAADGVNSHTARCLGWADGRRLAPALEWEVPVSPACLRRFPLARFDFGVPTDGYAWIFPKQNHLSVGLGSMRNRARHLPAQLRAYLQMHGVEASGPIHYQGHLIPVSPRKAPLARGRVLLVGDAAGLTDPVTAEGLTFALHSGLLAAEALCETGSGGDAAACYQHRLEQEVLPEIRAGLWLAALVYRLPVWRDKLFRRHGQQFAEAMADLVQGRRSYRAVLSRIPFWLKILGVR